MQPVYLLVIACFMFPSLSKGAAFEPSIGVVMDLTTTRVASEDTIRGLKVGTEYLRRKKNQKLNLKIIDSGPLASGTSQAMRGAIDANYDILIAEIASSKAEIAAELAQKAKKVMITTFATASSITEARDFIFRPCATHQLQAQALSKYLSMRGSVSGAVIFDQGQLYSVDLAKKFRTEFGRLGGKLNPFKGIISSSEEFEKGLRFELSSGSKFVYIPMYEEASARVVKQLLSEKVTQSVQLIGGDGWQIGDLIKSVVLKKFPDAELSVVTHHNPLGKSAIQREFEELFEAKFGSKPETSGSYLAFDTMLVISEIFHERLKLSQEEIKARLANKVNVAGTTGDIKFRRNQEPENKRLYLAKYRGEKLVSVEELKP